MGNHQNLWQPLFPLIKEVSGPEQKDDKAAKALQEWKECRLYNLALAPLPLGEVKALSVCLEQIKVIQHGNCWRIEGVWGNEIILHRERGKEQTLRFHIPFVDYISSIKIGGCYAKPIGAEIGTVGYRVIGNGKIELKICCKFIGKTVA